MKKDIIETEKISKSIIYFNKVHELRINFK